MKFRILELKALRYTVVGAVAAVMLLPLAGPANALRVCYCQKGVSNPEPRCGEMIVHDPTNKYEFDEEYRGNTRLDPQNYLECPSSAKAAEQGSCPKAVTPVATPVEEKKCPDAPKLVEPICPACAASPALPEDRLGVYGSNTIGEKLMPRLIGAYGKRFGWDAAGIHCGSEVRLKNSRTGQELTIDCQDRGSETGIKALIQEKADIAMLSRPIEAKEVAAMRQEGFPKMTSALAEHVLALDGVPVITATDSSIWAPSSLDEIANTFSAPPRGVTLYIRDEKSGTRKAFEELVMKPRNKSLPPCPSSDANVKCFGSSSELVKAVAGDRYGIGFVGFAYTRDEKSGVATVPVKGSCGIVQKASSLMIKTEDYLLSRRLFLYTARAHSFHSNNLLFFALSDVAQPEIERAGYVNQLIDQVSPQESLGRLEQYQSSPPHEPGLDFDWRTFARLHERAKGASRLSISYRFRYNSSTLDTKAAQDVNRLADYLTSQEPRATVLLAGFTDALGDFGGNAQLSLERAKAVAKAIEDKGISTDRLVAEGYSELLPVACNDNAEGQAKNRRVEVWLLPGR